MNGRRTYRVGELARMTGVSVRALHHYDQIGLLVPKARSRAGYRVYDQDDVLRLQQILIGREQGLALEEIRRALDDPSFDLRRALLAQRKILEEHAARAAEQVRAIDAALRAIEHAGEDEMDLKALFDGFDPAQHEAEAEARYGHTEAYREASRRTRRYTPNDWKRFQAEQASLYADAFAALSAGKPPDSAEAMDIAERHRCSIERWFYPCSPSFHARLADLYEADPRFADHIDRFGAGLTPFLSAAIRANATRPAT